MYVCMRKVMPIQGRLNNTKKPIDDPLNNEASVSVNFTFRFNSCDFLSLNNLQLKLYRVRLLNSGTLHTIYYTTQVAKAT